MHLELISLILRHLVSWLELCVGAFCRASDRMSNGIRSELSIIFGVPSRKRCVRKNKEVDPDRKPTSCTTASSLLTGADQVDGLLSQIVRYH